MILDFKRQVEEGLRVLAEIATVFASHDRARLATKYVLEKVLLARRLQQALQPIEEDIQVLLRILLLPHVGRHSTWRLEAVAEVLRIATLPIRQLEEPKYILHLVQNIIIDIFAFELSQVLLCFILSSHQAVPQRRHVEELLVHRVHVANGPKIQETTVAVDAAAKGRRREARPRRLVDLEDLRRPVVLEDLEVELLVRVDPQHGEEEIEACPGALLRLALVDVKFLVRLEVGLGGDVRLYCLEVHAKEAALEEIGGQLF